MTTTICPSAVALDDAAGALDILREMRDARMAGSCQGRSLIDLYYEHAEEVSGILNADQELKMVAHSVLGEIVENAAALNTRGEVGINQELVEDILALADTIDAYASPELKRAINRVRKEIEKGSIFEQMGWKCYNIRIYSIILQFCRTLSA